MVPTRRTIHSGQRRNDRDLEPSAQSPPVLRAGGGRPVTELNFISHRPANRGGGIFLLLSGSGLEFVPVLDGAFGFLVLHEDEPFPVFLDEESFQEDVGGF